MQRKKRRIEHEPKLSTSFIGNSHAEDPYLIPHLGVLANTFVTRGIDSVGQDAYFATYTHSCDCANRVRLDASWMKIEAQVAEYKDVLLALFFKFVDWTFPAVDKRSFYTKYFNASASVNTGLVTAMLGLRCTYWKYSTQLCVRPIPKNLVNSLWEQCINEINHDITCTGPDSETLQALLLYTQKRLSSEGYHEQVCMRIEVGKLVSLANMLGLHVNCTNWDLQESQKQVRNRMSAAVYVVEVWSAILLGQPSLTTYMSIDFTSDWPQEIRFVELVKLTKIVQKYASIVPCSSTSTLSRESAALDEIDDWWQNLPKEIQNMNTKNNLNYCSNGMIHLAGLSAEVLLVYRRYLEPSLFITHAAKAKSLVHRIMSFFGNITHSHLHAFWLSCCRLMLSCLAHYVLRYYAQTSDEERLRDAHLTKSWAEGLRSLNIAWEEGLGLAQERMDALFHKGVVSIKLQPVRLADTLDSSEFDNIDEQLENIVYNRQDTNSPIVMSGSEDNLEQMLLDILLNFDSHN